MLQPAYVQSIAVLDHSSVLYAAEILCKALVLVAESVRSGFCSLQCSPDIGSNYRLQTHHNFGWVFRLLLKPKGVRITPATIMTAE